MTINHSNLVNIQVSFVIFLKSNLLLHINEGSNVTLESISIIDSTFNLTDVSYAIINISAKRINIQEILISNSTYHPTNNIVDLKVKFGLISSVHIYNITIGPEHILAHLPKFLLNFDTLNIEIKQLSFVMMVIKH